MKEVGLVKKVVGTALAAAGLVGLLSGTALGERNYKRWTGSGLGVTHIPCPDALELSEDPVLREQQLIRIGRYIAERLGREDSCDDADYTLMDVLDRDQTGKAVYDQGKPAVVGKRLLVGCYDVDEDGRWPIWKVDLTGICSTFLTQERFLFLKLGDYVTVEGKSGEVSRSVDLSEEMGELLTELFTEYALRNNQRECVDYKLFVQINYGPGGPE